MQRMKNASKAEGFTNDRRKKRDDDGRPMTTDQPCGMPPTTEHQWKPRQKAMTPSAMSGCCFLAPRTTHDQWVVLVSLDHRVGYIRPPSFWEAKRDTANIQSGAFVLPFEVLVGFRDPLGVCFKFRLIAGFRERL